MGASRADVLKLIVREGMVLAAIGMSVGVVTTLVLTRLLTAMLYGVRPADPATLLAVLMTVAAVAFVASYFPARRATKVEPIAALRYE